MAGVDRVQAVDGKGHCDAVGRRIRQADGVALAAHRFHVDIASSRVLRTFHIVDQDRYAEPAAGRSCGGPTDEHERESQHLFHKSLAS